MGPVSIWILLTGILVRTKVEGLPQDDLIRSLLYDYEVDAAPVTDASSPVVVEADFFIQSLQEILWTDPRLAWDPNDHSNMTSIVLHGNHIWTPDLVVRNSLRDMYENLQGDHFRAQVSHTGRVRYWIGGATIISCSLDLTYFPFDTQACYVHVNSWSYVVQTVKLTTVQKSVKKYKGYNSQWDIIDSNASSFTEHYSTGNSFNSVIYRIVFQRKPGFYIGNIIFPCIMLSILSLLVFLIPVNVGDRISYGITVLLSFTVFQLIIADSLPRTSDHLPHIISYLISVMSLTALAIICSVFVLYIQCRSEVLPIPKWFYLLTFSILSKRACSRSGRNQKTFHNYHESTKLASDVCAEGHSVNSPEMCEKLDWKDAACVWDRFFFILFSLILLFMSLTLLYILPHHFNIPKTLDDYVQIS